MKTPYLDTIINNLIAISSVRGLTSLEKSRLKEFQEIKKILNGGNK